MLVGLAWHRPQPRAAWLLLARDPRADDLGDVWGEPELASVAATCGITGLVTLLIGRVGF